jgi:hypothetical protein
VTSDRDADFVPIPCRLCDERFDSPTAFQAHLMDKHPLGSPIEIFNPETKQFERNRDADDAALIEHWDECPLPPDANCQRCWEHARRFLNAVHIDGPEGA